jgi:glycosyltransferase involved in cell wall biosynthesis
MRQAAFASFKPCLLIPHYNHHQQLTRVFEQFLALGLPIVIVDDGSSDDSRNELQQLCANNSTIEIFYHEQNQGKGGAVMTGIRNAEQLGFSHALQIDADGQHSISDAAKFLAFAERHPDTLVCGKPLFADDISKGRYYGRMVTIVLVGVQTLSRRVVDPMCGFRVYPLAAVRRVIDNSQIGKRMDFDVELLVKCDWQGLPLQFIPTKVAYPDDGMSHFNYVADNIIMAKMHARLLIGMLWRIPKLLMRHLT